MLNLEEGLEGGMGGPNPAIPLLFHENPASRIFFITISNPIFLSQKKKKLESLISKKANNCKI